MKTKVTESSKRLPWEAVLFLALYVVLPDYFAIELHSKLPLITGSRMVLVLLGVMLIVHRRNDLFCFRNFKWSRLNLQLTDDRFLSWGFLLYFFLLLLTHIALFFTDAPEAVKAIFVLFLEQYVLIWLLSLYIDTREKIVAALKVLVISSGVVALFSVVGCALDMNPFALLNTVSRKMLMTNYYRMGMLRIEAGFGHPVFYGAYCVIMVPLNMYLIEYSTSRKEKLLFAACLALNVAAAVLANSRGSLLALVCIMILIFVLRLFQKSVRCLLKTYLPVFAGTLVVLFMVASVSPMGLSFLGGIAKSVMDAVVPSVVEPGESHGTHTDEPGFIIGPETGEDEPEIPYGENENGLSSRVKQLSGIEWTLSQRPLFGFGSNAHVRGLICFRFNGQDWWRTESFDMALVAIICQYGIVGFLGYFALYGSLIKTIFSKKYRKDKIMYFLGLAFIAYGLCLQSIACLDGMGWILMSLMLCMVNIIRREQSELTKT